MLPAGWQRMSLLISFFKPSTLRDPKTFAKLGNKLICFPVTQALVFSKIPGPSRRWINSMTRDWDIRSVIPCHFAAPVPANGDDIK